MKRITLILVSLMLLSSSIFAGDIIFSSGDVKIESVERQFISIDDFYQLLSTGADYLLLDNRKPEDWEKSNICDSVNADMDAAVTYGDYIKAMDILKSVLKKETGAENGNGKKIILACYTGNRYATAATNILNYLGADMSKVYTLEGGNTAWNQSQYVQSVLDYEASVLSRAASAGKASDYDWGDDFNFAKRKGSSDMDLTDVLDIMTITTPCAFESAALQSGYNASFNYMSMERINSNEMLEGTGPKTVSIKFNNGKTATAELKWPQNTTLVSILPVPDGKNTKVVYGVYDDKTLLVLYNKMDESYIQSVMNALKTAYPTAIAEGDDYYKGKDSKGGTVSFSSELKSVIIDR